MTVHTFCRNIDGEENRLANGANKFKYCNKTLSDVNNKWQNVSI